MPRLLPRRSRNRPGRHASDLAGAHLDGADLTEAYLEGATLGGTSLTGGRFSIGGTVLGALIIQTLSTTIISIGVPTQTTLVFKAIVVIIVSLLQSPVFRAKVFGWRKAPPAPIVTTVPAPEMEVSS